MTAIPLYKKPSCRTLLCVITFSLSKTVKQWQLSPFTRNHLAEHFSVWLLSVSAILIYVTIIIWYCKVKSWSQQYSHSKERTPHMHIFIENAGNLLHKQEQPHKQGSTSTREPWEVSTKLKSYACPVPKQWVVPELLSPSPWSSWGPAGSTGPQGSSPLGGIPTWMGSVHLMKKRKRIRVFCHTGI